MLSIRPARPFRCCELFLVAGRGMITSLPSNYTLRFLLSGRVGVNAAAHAWGRTLQLGGHDPLARVCSTTHSCDPHTDGAVFSPRHPQADLVGGQAQRAIAL